MQITQVVLVPIVTANTKLQQLYIYPIKSIRGIPVQDAIITKTGLAHDRQFMLLKAEEVDGKITLKNMHVPHFPTMCLFTTSFQSSESSAQPDNVIVTYSPSKDPDVPGPRESRTLEVPLCPNVAELEEFEVLMHSSPTTAYRMPESFSSWFSECFGFQVILAYIGTNTRAVLGTLSPNANKPKQSQGYLSSLKSTLGWGQSDAQDASISFADCANFLVVTEESLANCSERLPGDEKMEVTKFRPNIVVSGSDAAWDEDYWASISIASSASNGHENEAANKVEIIFTANCVRCASINVDYTTGKMGTGESGQMLKKLQKDRRIDLGSKYSPVFGRYGFLGKGLGCCVRIGARVAVEGRNEGHSKFGKLFLRSLALMSINLCRRLAWYWRCSSKDAVLTLHISFNLPTLAVVAPRSNIMMHPGTVGMFAGIIS